MTVVRVIMEFGSEKPTVLAALESTIHLVKTYSEELAESIVSVIIKD